MSNEFDALESKARNIVQRMTSLRRQLIQSGLVPNPTTVSAEELALPITRLIEVLDAFPGLVGYLNGRRGGKGVAAVESEADVQDLLYLSLKPIFPELVYEQPTKKGSAGYSIGDFHIPTLNLIVEAKYVNKPSDVKARADEIAEDIWKYTSQTDCERIIFFIYDPKILIPDRPNYAKSLSAKPGEYKKAGRDIAIWTVIKP
jgi:REase_DpnII-MboI